MADCPQARLGRSWLAKGAEVLLREEVGVPTNMADVAAFAGVSQRTVSNVVRGYKHVRPETRERVQQAIQQLNYRPNATAQSLRRGRTGIVGLAVPELDVPYFAEMAKHVQRIAAANGLTLLVDQTGGDRDHELRVVQGYGIHVIDGLILSPMAMTVEDLDDNVPAMPLVLVGERIRSRSLTNVAIDDVVAAKEATLHLLASGRRRIAAVGADLTTNNVGAALGRLKGYRDAHHERGLVCDPHLELPTGNWTRAAGYAIVDALMSRTTRVDALLCFNDMLAFGAMKALRDHGARVPGDVSVVGWDDVEEAAYSNPSLTSVSPDKEMIAESAVQALTAQIGGEPVDAAEVRCGHRLVVRESTAGTY